MHRLAEYVQAALVVLGPLGFIVALAVIWAAQPPDNDNKNNDNNNNDNNNNDNNNNDNDNDNNDNDNDNDNDGSGCGDASQRCPSPTL
jgi:hypothetical protein